MSPEGLSIIASGWRLRRHGYPVVQSVESIAPLAAEFVVIDPDGDAQEHEFLHDVVGTMCPRATVSFVVGDACRVDATDLLAPGSSRARSLTLAMRRARSPACLIHSFDEIWSAEAVAEAAHILHEGAAGPRSSAPVALEVPVVEFLGLPGHERAVPGPCTAARVVGPPSSWSVRPRGYGFRVAHVGGGDRTSGDGGFPPSARRRCLGAPIFALTYSGAPAAVARRIRDQADSFLINDRYLVGLAPVASRIIAGRARYGELLAALGSIVAYDDRWPVPPSIAQWWSECDRDIADHDASVLRRRDDLLAAYGSPTQQLPTGGSGVDAILDVVELLPGLRTRVEDLAARAASVMRAGPAPG